MESPWQARTWKNRARKEESPEHALRADEIFYGDKTALSAAQFFPCSYLRDSALKYDSHVRNFISPFRSASSGQTAHSTCRPLPGRYARNVEYSILHSEHLKSSPTTVRQSSPLMMGKVPRCIHSCLIFSLPLVKARSMRSGLLWCYLTSFRLFSANLRKPGILECHYHFSILLTKVVSSKLYFER